MPYPRFTKVIIDHFISKDNSISMRNIINLHTAHDDSLLGALNFVTKTEDCQKYGALIPDGMINDDIKLSTAYKTYLEYATGKVPPKKARKLKKHVSPKLKIVLASPKEPTQKGKCSTEENSEEKQARNTQVRELILNQSDDDSWGNNEDENDDFNDEDDVGGNDDDGGSNDDGDNDAQDNEQTDSDDDENPSLFSEVAVIFCLRVRSLLCLFVKGAYGCILGSVWMHPRAGCYNYGIRAARLSPGAYGCILVTPRIFKHSLLPVFGGVTDWYLSQQSCLLHHLRLPALPSTPTLSQGGYFREPMRRYLMEVLRVHIFRIRWDSLLQAGSPSITGLHTLTRGATEPPVPQTRDKRDLGYVVVSDPEEDPEEYEDDETEDGLIDYPIDEEEDGDDDDTISSG
ncbi:hypothetical protein Tco_1006071 [Tanacetum coccineum]|uniref:Uncharacterized protein n=1 Tax=Tanacetum coccineum TaxID=301880 RepID=A0ABQ5FHY8_9ASTR